MSWAESAYVVETLKQWLSDGTGSGIPCNPCSVVGIATGENDVTIRWYNGQDLDIGEGALRQVLARSFGVTIVAREGRPPRNVRDGKIVYQDPMDPDLTFLEDYPTGDTGVLYTTVPSLVKNKLVYYGVFARTDHGVLNYDTSQIVGMITPGGLYGFRQMYHEPLVYNIKPLHGCTQYKPVRGLQPGASWGEGPTLAGGNTMTGSVRSNPTWLTATGGPTTLWTSAILPSGCPVEALTPRTRTTLAGASCGSPRCMCARGTTSR